MKNIRINLLIALAGVFVLSSCNKELEQFAPIVKPAYPTGTSIAATLAASPNDSLFNRMLIRSGLQSLYADSTKTFTLFAVDNAGMRLFVTAASGGLVPPGAPDAVVSGFIANNLPAASAAGIIQYNTVGQKLPAASIGTAFPNYPYVSQIILDPTQPFVRMNNFPVRGTTYSYLNNMPLTTVDQTASNGIIHRTYTVVAPPTATLKTMIAADTSLTYFAAAVARADSGSVGLSKFDSLLNYGVTNMTVLAPNNNAFRTLVYGLVYSQVFAATGNATIANAQASGAVAAGPAFLGTNNVTTALVKGIVAYHLLASLTSSTTTPYQPNIRVFSVNIPSAPTFVKTLVNGSLAIHPGISAKATYAGPFATGASFTGYGTFPSGGTPYSGPAANATVIDKLAVNGVYHIIDRVLLPQ